jgi:hypothetical protein
MFLTISTVLNSVYQHQVTLGEIIGYGITLIIGIGIFIKWICGKNILNHPFKIREAQEDYNYQGRRTLSKETIIIKYLNSKWNKNKINLHLTARRKIDFKKINLRFVEDAFFLNFILPQCWKKVKDASKEIISIKKIDFPQEKYYSKMIPYDDKKGGFDGVFNPPISLSKDNIIFLEVYPNIINIHKKWGGYISLDNSSGEEIRTFTRKKVIITNKQT